MVSAGPDPRLMLVLGGLKDRIGQRDDLVSITVDAGDRRLGEITHERGGGGLVLKGAGRREPFDAPDLAARLAGLVAGEQSFTITVHERMHTMIIRSERGKISTRMIPVGATPQSPGRQTEPGTRQAFIDAGAAEPLLKALDIMTADGRIPPDRRRKLFQVDRFVELVDHMLAGWPEGEILTVLDCASGKSYLSFVLNHYLTEVRRLRCSFICIDTDEAVIRTSRSIGEELGYRNMEFIRSDIASFRPRGPVHMVLSLHACDTATDEALALGISHGARMIVAVPCCQAALTDQLDLGFLEPMARHGVFRRHLADLLTDGLRALCLESHGYRVSVVEYVSPLDTPKNIMLRALRSGRGGGERAERYRDICRQLGVRPWIDRLLAGERTGSPARHHPADGRSEH